MGCVATLPGDLELQWLSSACASLMVGRLMPKHFLAGRIQLVLLCIAAAVDKNRRGQFVQVPLYRAGQF